MGGAGAPTGFARTFPMRDDPLGRLDPTSEREDQQIRFWEQAKGLRDSRRFAVGFSHASTPSRTRNRRTSHKDPSFSRSGSQHREILRMYLHMYLHTQNKKKTIPPSRLRPDGRKDVLTYTHRQMCFYFLSLSLSLFCTK